MMHLLHLPLELFRQILISAIEVRGVERGLRLRLVNKNFDTEVAVVLLGSTLLDEKFGNLLVESKCLLPPFAAKYLQRRVLSEPSDGNKVLLQIREVSRRLQDASAGLGDKQDHLGQLCRLAMDSDNKHRARLIFDPGREILPTDVDIHACVAALAFNVRPIVEQWVREKKELPQDSKLFGSTAEHVLNWDDLSVLDSLLSANDSTEANAKRLSRLREAAEFGSLNAVRYIWDFNTAQYPWIFDRMRPHIAYKNEWGLAFMNTPSPEVFDFLLEKRRQHCSTTLTTFDAEYYTELLRECAVRGWHETMDRYIQLGADVDGLECYGHEKRPLVDACSNGHEEVVRVLLAHDTDTSAPALEVAAWNGHLSIVRILLHHGAESGNAVSRALAKGYMDVVHELLGYGAAVGNYIAHFLVFAVEREHTFMFHFLQQRAQKPIAPRILAVCRKLATEQGLESMLELLEEADVDSEGPS